MVYTKPISPEQKAYLFCFRDRWTSAIEICRRLKISKASFCRIYNYVLQTEKTCSTKVKRLPGCRRKLSDWQIRILLRTLKILRRQEGNFSISRLMEVAKVNRREVSVRTVWRVLNEQFPMEKQREIPPCANCFAELLNGTSNILSLIHIFFKVKEILKTVERNKKDHNIQIQTKSDTNEKLIIVILK